MYCFELLFFNHFENKYKTGSKRIKIPSTWSAMKTKRNENSSDIKVSIKCWKNTTGKFFINSPILDKDDSETKKMALDKGKYCLHSTTENRSLINDLNSFPDETRWKWPSNLWPIVVWSEIVNNTRVQRKSYEFSKFKCTLAPIHHTQCVLYT